MLRKITTSVLTFLATLGLLLLLSPQAGAASGKSQGDLNNSGKVDIFDLSILMSDYGTSNAESDIDGNGAVNIFDLSILLSNYDKIVAPVDPTPPAVSFTAPAPNATLSGSQTLSADASDAASIEGVQFKVDGVNIGNEDISKPYSVNWDSTSVANGNHTLSVVARNSSNLTATANETINVQNVLSPPPPPPTFQNIIPNPSLEAASGGVPSGWNSSKWGANTSSFSYLSTGHTGSHSVKVTTSSYTDGAANWYYDDVSVSAGKTYKYVNWYQANVDTEVDAEVVMADGSTKYFWLGNVAASTEWAEFSTTFTVPEGGKRMAIYQILAKKGYLISDDYSLSEYTPQPFNRALVSITFDDGWANQYANGFPLLQKYGLPATFYIISGELTDQPDYMSANQVKNLQAAGNEIGSHTITHSDLTTVSSTQLQRELQESQTTLQNVIGVPVTNFAYPYGAYNSNTISVGKQYYRSQRTVNGGLNTKDSLDLTQLKIHEVDSDITQSQVRDWVNEATVQKAWLILVYHEIANTPVDPSDSLYTTKPADLDAELAYIKSTGVAVLTVNQAIDEVLSQL